MIVVKVILGILLWVATGIVCYKMLRFFAQMTEKLCRWLDNHEHIP